MQQISFYLEKFKNVGFKQNKIFEIIIFATKKETGILLEKKDIKIIKESIKINKSGPEKTEIFLKKEEIEKTIKKLLEEELKIKSSKKII